MKQKLTRTQITAIPFSYNSFLFGKNGSFFGIDGIVIYLFFVLIVIGVLYQELKSP